MNWGLLVGLLVGLGGAIHFLSQPLGPTAFDGEYRRHLRASEKAALARGETVTKVHWAYTDIWHLGHREGPLRVQPMANGQLKFTQFGYWQGFRGERLVWDSDEKGRYTSVGHFYDSDGSVLHLSLAAPALFAGDTIVEVHFVHFTRRIPQDTIAVQHWFKALTGKSVKPEVWTYDLAGRRPVPKGWTFRQ